MGYRLPRIEFARTYSYTVTDLSVSSPVCVTPQFIFYMIGESPWVNEHDIVLTQVDIYETSGVPIKTNYTLFMSSVAYTDPGAGTNFALTVSDVNSIKGMIPLNGTYVDIVADQITVLNVKDINHRFNFSQTDSSSLYCQLIAGTGGAYAAGTSLFIKCHFAIQ